MDREALLNHLQFHFARPQKSERWAMYRLIVPIVDYAKTEMGLNDFFEFTQTSQHGTSQAVDIVLRAASGAPEVMIEAKSVDKRISAELIEKYLSPGVRGVVTNGVHWVLCRDGRNKLVMLRESTSEDVVAEAFDEIVSFIRGAADWAPSWGSEEPTYTDSPIKPERIVKAIMARRPTNARTISRTGEAFRREVAALSHLTELERVFLEVVATELERAGDVPHLRCEVRETRISFFDERKTSSSKRVARCHVGKLHPDLLVLTDLVTSESRLGALSQATPHERGPHMRRFRLSDSDQAKEFGKALATVLIR